MYSLLTLEQTFCWANKRLPSCPQAASAAGAGGTIRSRTGSPRCHQQGGLPSTRSPNPQHGRREKKSQEKLSFPSLMIFEGFVIKQ